jgi:CheY-like chemotaxis protein
LAVPPRAQLCRLSFAIGDAGEGTPSIRGIMANIIIIDDDESYGALLRLWLNRAGMDVTLHTSPFGTLNVIRKGSFDLIVLDISMPALDGPHLVKLIRDTKGIEHMKILLCSRIEEDALYKIAQRSSVTAFISKSCSQNEFVGAVIGAMADNREALKKGSA